MKPTPVHLADLRRRSFLHRSAGILAASAGCAEPAGAETVYGVETPDLRSRAEIGAMLGQPPFPALRSGPTADPGASRQKQIPSSLNPSHLNI